MDARIARRPLAAALVAAVYIASALVFGSLSGTSGANHTVDVATEAEYRAALTALSADATGPHTINITADFGISDLGGDGDPTYTGTQPLMINGGGHTVDGNVPNTRFLTHNSAAALTIQNLTLTDFQSPGDGGAVHGSGGGDVTIQNSTLSGNTATFNGGAVATGAATGDVTIQNSTLSENTAVLGGGAVRTSGGDGNVTLIHATVASNTAPEGANIQSGNIFTSFASVVADPRGEGDNCSGTEASTSTYSYDDDGSCGFTDPTDTSDGPDPQLGELADNGGPTQTMLPQAGSPLIDAIPEEDCHDTVTADQRGVSRPQDGNEDGVLACDIGAVEVQPAEEAPAARPVDEDPAFTG